MRARLAPDELLIELVAFDKHYGAFLLDHAGALSWVDLGPAQPIDQAVRDLIEGANDWSVSLAHREKQAAASAEEHRTGSAPPAFETAGAFARSLGRQLQRPPPAHLARRIADAGSLRRPCGFHGHFLIERFAISYLSAGRDLVASENPASHHGSARDRA